jgi:hypothetical protein
MTGRKIKISGLNKTEWKGQERKILRKGYEFIWSSTHTGNIHGAVIMLSPTFAAKVLGTEFICGRVLKIKHLLKRKNMDSLQIYKLQIGCNIEEKEDFKEIIET